MADVVRLPALGDSVTAGTVTRWLKAEGERVEVDEPLLEISTDKVDTELPSPFAGTLSTILVAEDDTVPVGAELAIINGATGEGEAARQKAPTEGVSPQLPANEDEQRPATTDASTKPQTAQAVPPGPEVVTADVATTDRPYVTPLVRKLAAENHVDLGAVKGTGVGERIRKQDVLEAAEKAKAPAPAAAPAAAPSAPAASAPSAPAVSPKRGTTEKMSRLRKVIAQRMVESLRVSAQLTTVVEVDVTKIARLRGKAKGEFERREGVKLSFLPFLALAAVEALKAHPNVNASVEGDQ
ncbi:MAG: biotin/lipoyl-containing protein, partial [Mycobacteriaceae bacterium]